MKKLIFLSLALPLLAACEKDMGEAADDTRTITFQVSTDHSDTWSPVTRSLQADGKDMTDVWVLDYVGTELQQTIHQSNNAAADFGSPTLDLSVGTHQLYFIASRGTVPELDTDTKTLSFTKVLDTFWCKYPITITSGTSNSSSVTVDLDRIVTKLKLTFLDAIPTGASTFSVTPTSWYYSFDYTTGQPKVATISSPVVVSIPSGSIGKTGESVNVYGFSTLTEWNTNISVSCKTAGNVVLGSATISGAPFTQNRASEYTGRLFTSSGSWSLNLNSDWSTAHTGTW